MRSSSVACFRTAAWPAVRCGGKVKRPKPTIFDVAQRADVSVGTVSHVLNDSCKVSEGRRLRVHQAIKELGYLPNSLAQGLRRQRSRLVGLCLPHTSSAYLAALIDVFEEIAANRGYEIMQVLSRNDPLTEIHRVRRAADAPGRRPDPGAELRAAPDLPARRRSGRAAGDRRPAERRCPLRSGDLRQPRGHGRGDAPPDRARSPAAAVRGPLPLAGDHAATHREPARGRPRRATAGGRGGAGVRGGRGGFCRPPGDASWRGRSRRPRSSSATA